MNCQEFDQIVNDLAHPKLPGIMEASLSNRGLAHATTCQRCSVQLSNTRALIESLGALAKTTENNAATAQTETVLLAAFRQQHATTASPSKSNVVSLPAVKFWQKRLPAWAYAAAAAVIIAAAGFAASLWIKPSPKPAEVTIVPSPSPSPETRIPIQPVIVTPQQEQKSQQGQLAVRKKTRHRQNAADDGSSVQSSLGELIPIYREEEVATDFLSLTHETDSQPMESGQLIRVQVPRTALASFGLPINIERANEPIKADLLLADDGSARAIRFIR